MNINEYIEFLDNQIKLAQYDWERIKFNEIIKSLQILEELKRSISPGGIIEIDYYKDDPLPDASGIRFVCKWLNKLEQKYFPKQVKKITIEIEAENKEILIKQLELAKEKLLEHPFCNVLCFGGDKFQFDIQDKEGD